MSTNNAMLIANEVVIERLAKDKIQLRLCNDGNEIARYQCVDLREHFAYSLKGIKIEIPVMKPWD